MPAKSPQSQYHQSFQQRPSHVLSACNTSTFYMHLKAPVGEQINIKDIVTLTDGNFLLAGNIRLPNTEQAGMLCLLNNAGNIIAQRQIRINDQPTTVFNAKAALDGSFVMSGIMHGITDEVFVAHINSDLSTNWIKTFAMQTRPLNVVMELQPDNSVAFAVQLQNALFYSLINAGGSGVWSQQAVSAGLDNVAGVGNSSAGISLVLNCTRAGKKLIELLTVNEADGSLIDAYTMGNGADSRVAGKLSSFAGRFISLGVLQTGPSQFKLVRDILYNAQILETEHTYTIPGTVDFNTTSALDNAGDALGFCMPAQGKMVYIRHFAYYQTSPEYTRQYTVPPGSGMAGIARSLTDGGYLFGLNTASGSECILIKTDSIGAIAGCGFTDITNNYNEAIQLPNTVSATTAAGASAAGVSASLSAADILLNVQTDCNQNLCPPAPPDDTCLSSFFKTFRSNSYVDEFTGYHLMRNNNHLMLTARYDRIAGSENQLTYGIKLFNEKGNFIKGVNIFSDGVSVTGGTKQIDDSHVLLIYYSTYAGIPCYSFTMINDDLQLLWTRSFKTFDNFGFNVNFTFDKEGNVYLIGNTLGFYEDAKVLAFKMDATGNPAWLKVYQIHNQNMGLLNATTTNTSLMAVIEGGSQGCVSVSIDKNTGEMQHAYKYNNSGAGIEYDRIVQFDNDRIFYAGNDNRENFAMGIFDTTGKPLVLKSIENSSIIRAGAVKAGKLYAHYYYFNGTENKNVLLKADSALSLEYMHESDFTVNDGLAVGMGLNDNGSIYIAGDYSSGGVNGSYFDPYLKKFAPDGTLGTCGYSNGSPVINNIALNTAAIDFSPVGGYAFTAINIPIEFEADSYGQQINKLLCSSSPACNKISLAGTTNICGLNLAHTFYAKRNPGCTLKPLWIYDTAMATLTNVTDTSADLSFKKTGSTWVKVTLDAGCNTYSDSLLVQIQNVTATLNLGSDTVLCKGDKFLLHAGKGFSSYRWQDGSSDSTFTVTKAGQYFVQVSSFCGASLRDTIDIKAAAIPLLDIGKDSAVCFGDTVIITASPGFNQYSWQPASLKNTIRPGQVYDIVTGDETISLKAVTVEGCFAYDTLQLTTIHARAIQLGGDTSFCLHDSIILSAGSGYLQYSWSTGSTLPGITVKQAGAYWVSARDINGCTAWDTLRVVKLYALPAPDLGNDFDLCKGRQRQLDAGNYLQYLWQDGSGDRYFTVRNPGNYWVKVTDSHHCSFSDSVILKQLLPDPGNFLQSIDSICSYETYKIIPSGSYASYVWPDGSSQPELTVGAPGNYILTVTDANGCAGSDTIKIVQKNCVSGVYIPTAFSPNGDVLNDVFKATVYGNLVSFRLEIFNRYGELIFSTADPKKGWDGSVKGKKQPGGTFIWQCSYQPVGWNMTYQKGTVTLVR